MSKKRRKKKNKKIVKQMALVPVKKQETALVVVEKKKLDLDINRPKKIFEKVVKKLSLALISTMSIAYVFGLIIVATSVFYISHLQNGLIQRGVYVNGISVSDLTSDQALASVNSQLNENIPEFLTIKYKDNKYQIRLQDLELNFDVETAVKDAYEIGRTQHVVKDLYDYAEVLSKNVNIDSELSFNEEVLEKCIDLVEEQLPDKVVNYSYNIENGKLIILRGKSGVGIEKEQLKNLIVENLKKRDYDTEIEIPTHETLPEEINVQKIHDEVHIEPVDAYFTENPLEVHKEVIGIDFNTQVVQDIINTNPTQERYDIDLEFKNPNIFLKDLSVYPDLLATFSTRHSNNANRTNNLAIAASKITGTVLMPGEKFSFNSVVGERTIAQGYRNAAIFVNGKVEDGLAGGICQVSSTLYNAVVGANLKVIERHNHSKLTSYLPGGKDATVAWGRYDFQFENNREYPIKIEMAVQNGFAIANIYGIKSNEEYEISIESHNAGVAGVYSIYNAYKVYRQNGVEVKREFLSRDLYK